MIKVLYKLFLALMITLFIGFGIAVFYPSPKAPDYPTALEKASSDQLTTEQKQIESDYNIKQDKFQEDLSRYNRNVSAIIIGISILLLILSLTILLKVDLIGEGSLLSGLFTLLYGLGRGLATNDSKFQFLVVTIGLIVALILGYIKFIRPANLEAKKKSE